MARTHGRTRRGERLRTAPHAYWKTPAVVAGLRSSGMVAPLGSCEGSSRPQERIIALPLMVLDGPITSAAFQACVEQVPVPELQPGDAVIVDNLGYHKGPGVRAAIETAGARLLYLPPDRPDFDPIENAFANLKALRRNAAARGVTGPWSAIGAGVGAYMPRKCANSFAVAGYDIDAA
jgi:hypothetical protein